MSVKTMALAALNAMLGRGQSAPPAIPSRQVRRQRERLAAKRRTDALPARIYYPPMLIPRSKYQPHIGKKQRAKGAERTAALSFRLAVSAALNTGAAQQ